MYTADERKINIKEQLANYITKDFGAKVFPIHHVDSDGACSCHTGKGCNRSPGKHPDTDGQNWKEWLTSDPDTICQWFKDDPARNYAVAGSENLIIIDCDLKPDKGIDGTATVASLLNITVDELKTLTFAVETTSGGWHLYFRTDGRVFSNSVASLPGVDVRSLGGYVLGPGSANHVRQSDGSFALRSYTVINDDRVAPIPEKLATALEQASPETKDGKPISTDKKPESLIYDTAESINDAIAIIQKAKPAVEGDKGDNSTHLLCKGLIDAGVSPETAYRLLAFAEICLDEDGKPASWNDTCNPPWKTGEPWESPMGDLWTKVRSAARNRKELHGSKQDLLAFDSEQLSPENIQAMIEKAEKKIAPVSNYALHGSHDSYTGLALNVIDFAAEKARREDSELEEKTAKEHAAERKADIAKRLEASGGPFKWTRAEDFPPPKLIYGDELRRGEVTGLFADGGVGKTSYMVRQAIKCVLGGLEDEEETPIYETGCRVLFLSWEDEKEELEAKIHAYARHYNFAPDQIALLESNIHICYMLGGTDKDGNMIPPVILSRTDAGGKDVPDYDALNAIADKARSFKADVILADPLANMQSIPENDNNAMAKMTAAFRAMVKQIGCAAELAHHTRKPQDGIETEQTQHSGRGASSFSAGLRHIMGLAKVTKTQARDMLIPPDKVEFTLCKKQHKNSYGRPIIGYEFFERVPVLIGSNKENEERAKQGLQPLPVRESFILLPVTKKYLAQRRSLFNIATMTALLRTLDEKNVRVSQNQGGGVNEDESWCLDVIRAHSQIFQPRQLTDRFLSERLKVMETGGVLTKTKRKGAKGKGGHYPMVWKPVEAILDLLPDMDRMKADHPKAYAALAELVIEYDGHKRSESLGGENAPDEEEER